MVDDNNKTILILGGLVQHCKMIQDAQDKGYHVVVVDYLKGSPGKKIANQSYDISITDVDKIVQLCRRKKINAVMNYCIDPGQKPYQEICEKLNIPCYGTREQFDILTNKDKFHDVCVRNSVGVIPRFSNSYILANRNNKKIYPIVIKPVDGRASKGISFCFAEQELDASIQNAMKNSTRKKILFEKYMSSPEVCAKYFVCDSKIYLTSFSDTYSSYYEGKRAYIVGKSFPSKYYQEFLESSDKNIRNMIKNIGVKNGPLSFTGFYDNGTFRFFDPSFRLGGGLQARILQDISGVDLSKFMTNYALTGSMGDIHHELACVKSAIEQNYAAELYFLGKLGRIEKIIGLEKVAEFETVKGMHVAHNEGDLIVNFGTSDHVVIRLFLVSDSKEKIRLDIDRCESVVKVLDETGANMLLENFNSRLY